MQKGQSVKEDAAFSRHKITLLHFTSRRESRTEAMSRGNPYDDHGRSQLCPLSLAPIYRRAAVTRTCKLRRADSERRRISNGSDHTHLIHQLYHVVPDQLFASLRISVYTYCHDVHMRASLFAIFIDIVSPDNDASIML